MRYNSRAPFHLLMAANGLAQPANVSKQEHEIATLRRLSARIGSDVSLVQASTGNTSIKVNGDLWIKASGQWLADAQKRQVFVTMQLDRIRDLMARGEEFHAGSDAATGESLQPSIETPMHAVLPHRVVVHVHSISTIAWAVQRDGKARLAGLLAGLRWSWIPYVDSGFALAFAIRNALVHAPDADVFVLANHGLVICGPNCDSTIKLLNEVERRVAAAPRCFPDPDLAFLRARARNSGWQLPRDGAVHALGTDPVSRRILSNGFLYPCQAMFFHDPGISPFLVIEGRGVLLARDISRAESAMLIGLANIILRVAADAPIRYLEQSELRRVATANITRYRGLPQRHVSWEFARSSDARSTP
jgi:rhamnose utilization protein RhaD (predicted bifunctional aldolase and dehydrogenase)